MKIHSARFIVSGRVQGVFFRESTRMEANRLGLVGHARNLTDGTVEVLAAGETGAVEALQRWLRSGPPMARVDRVQRVPADDAATGLRGFTTG